MLATVLVGGVVLVLIGFAVRHVIRQHKSGGCSCGCGGCPHSGKCDK
ncbi:MAG: FeoB-associated Cys-rich membrane protein [Intestinibacillus sp.]